MLEKFILEQSGFHNFKSNGILVSDSIFSVLSQHAIYVTDPTTLLNFISPTGSVIIYCDLIFRLTLVELQKSLDNVMT